MKLSQYHRPAVRFEGFQAAPDHGTGLHHDVVVFTDVTESLGIGNLADDHDRNIMAPGVRIGAIGERQLSMRRRAVDRVPDCGGTRHRIGASLPLPGDCKAATLGTAVAGSAARHQNSCIGLEGQQAALVLEQYC